MIQIGVDIAQNGPIFNWIQFGSFWSLEAAKPEWYMTGTPTQSTNNKLWIVHARSASSVFQAIATDSHANLKDLRQCPYQKSARIPKRARNFTDAGATTTEQQRAHRKAPLCPSSPNLILLCYQYLDTGSLKSVLISITSSPGDSYMLLTRHAQLEKRKLEEPLQFAWTARHAGLDILQGHGA